MVQQLKVYVRISWLMCGATHRHHMRAAVREFNNAFELRGLGIVSSFVHLSGFSIHLVSSFIDTPVRERLRDASPCMRRLQAFTLPPAPRTSPC